MVLKMGDYDYKKNILNKFFVVHLGVFTFLSLIVI